MFAVPAPGTLTGMAVGGLSWSAIHRLAHRSGATHAEASASLPGDELLAHPMVEWTRATTIDGPPERVWPWLVQMGYGRGGWYTSELFDRVVWSTSSTCRPCFGESSTEFAPRGT